MGRFRVYIKPFEENGTYAADYTEVTEDVDFNALGSIKQVLDDDEFDVGVYKYSDFSIKLRNEHGRFSDVGGTETIFFYKRADSLLKITWQEQDNEALWGIAIAGEAIAGDQEVTVYEGLINDEATRTNIQDQVVTFRVLSKDSIFDRVETPFGSLSNGQSVNTILDTILNQTEITSLLTFDGANISEALSFNWDDVSDFENTTVKEALDRVLQASNSVLYINNDTIYVSDRSPSASVQGNFYGQASPNGIENIINIENISTGQSKMFNFWTWEDTTLKASDTTSVDLNGVRKKEVNFAGVTNSTTRQNILNELRTDFATKKQSFDLTAPLNATTLALSFLDKVSIDYPAVSFPLQNEEIAIYGLAVYGESFYPLTEYSLTIDDSQEFKIMGTKINPKTEEIVFKMREV